MRSPSCPPQSFSTAAGCWTRRRVEQVRFFGDQRLCGQNQSGNRGGVAHSAVADFHRIDDASINQIDEAPAARVKAETALALERLAQGDLGVETAVGGDVM